MYRIVLWDFDGTLFDTSKGIFQSLKTVFPRMRLAVPGQEILQKFIGPPLAYSFQNFCGMTKEDAARAILLFREHYSTKGIFESRVYDGLIPLLQGLRVRGIRCGVATLKPEHMAKLLLEHAGIDHLLEVCSGASCEEDAVTTKTQVIQAALARMGEDDPSDTVLIGDTNYDAVGAKEAGVAFIAAAYGFGFSQGEVIPDGCAAVVHTVQELKDFLSADFLSKKEIHCKIRT